MGAGKKRDRRAANYQERQRQDAARAKDEKERQKREEANGAGSIKQLSQYGSGWFSVSPGQQYYLTSGGWTVSSDYTPTAELDLPKAESTELITAYRMWNLKRTFPQGYRLVPMNELFGDVAPFEKMVARCHAGSTHLAPHESCTCGFHGYKESVPLDHIGKPYVVGEVNMWGKVVDHEDGYRAEFAYPKKLYVIDGGSRADKIAEALAWTYGVPCEVWDG